jgi:hypothetical protein
LHLKHQKQHETFHEAKLGSTDDQSISWLSRYHGKFFPEKNNKRTTKKTTKIPEKQHATVSSPWARADSIASIAMGISEQEFLHPESISDTLKCPATWWKDDHKFLGGIYCKAFKGLPRFKL